MLNHFMALLYHSKNFIYLLFVLCMAQHFIKRMMWPSGIFIFIVEFIYMHKYIYMVNKA